MNYISRLNVGVLLLSLAWCSACGDPTTNSYLPADPLNYRLDYVINPDPDSSSVAVTMRLSQAQFLLRELRMPLNPGISDLDADGDLSIVDNSAVWSPPATGGEFSWRVAVPHRRNGDGYDAWLDGSWGLFRAEDVIPRAATRTLKGASSETWLKLILPGGWSAVTQYFSSDGIIRVDNPSRRFDQPSGWMVLGELGVRRETISGVRVAVAGPIDNAIRRMDTLALLNWTLPELARLLPDLPPRLTIVSAGDPMWRGGLSAPQSLFIHADRPLISENATSTLLHEVMHMALGVTARTGHDWIVEGLAEFYSLELLHRSGTISPQRYAQARTDLATWAKDATDLCKATSTGATTALAVGLLADLDSEIRKQTAGDASLDDVTRQLTQIDGRIDLDQMAAIANEITGANSDTLHIDKLPGCRTLQSGK
jgi:hypothetical protein